MFEIYSKYHKKLQIFKIQDGRRPAFWKLLNRHISVKNCPILIKFGTLQQILNSMIQDGGGSDLENRFYSHNSSTDYPISANIGRESKTSWRQKPRDKNCNFFLNSRWRTAAILKSLNRRISVKILSDFDKNWCTTADIDPDEILKSTIAVS